ncbi:hypothetical protein [Bacillus cereus group sp. MYBK95-2]|uniref:hypothetical protein n=1 Tax=Bacillus cereus group sp. MYBK95-2 TaxID=3450599 RepID=UPI003F78D024
MKRKYSKYEENENGKVYIEMEEEFVSTPCQCKCKKPTKKKWMYNAWQFLLVIATGMLGAFVVEQYPLDLSGTVTTIIGLFSLAGTWFAIEAKYNK